MEQGQTSEQHAKLVLNAKAVMPTSVNDTNTGLIRPGVGTMIMQ